MKQPIVDDSIENCILDDKVDLNKIQKVSYDGDFVNGLKHGKGTF